MSYISNFRMIALSFAMTLPVVGCSVAPHSEELVFKPLNKKVTPTVVDHRSSYLREVTPIESFQSQKISFVGQTSLMDALRMQLPGINIMPGDANVDLSRSINVYAKNMSAIDFLDYLSAITGYELEYENKQVIVSSFIEKEWNLAVFSAKRDVKLQVGKSFSSASGGGNNTFNGKFTDDEWTSIVKGVEKILGASKSSGEGNMKPFVQAVRSVGLISAGGAPNKIKAVDSFINSLVEKGSKQVNIAVQAYEVTLDDKRGAGVDWKELSGIGTINGNPIDMNLLTSEGANGIGSLFENTVTYQSGKVNAEALFKFLSTFGEVELLNQPNVTVRNGTYAYISAGQEHTYIGEIEVEESSLTGTDAVTAKIESIRVGVTLSVAPRILDDGRILLEIWPSISSADLGESVSFGPGSVVLPKVQLQELATEVITESGRPVQLGGFIRRSIAKNLTELPWQEKISGKILNPIFKSETAELERTELVLTVTPTVVEGV